MSDIEIIAVTQNVGMALGDGGRVPGWLAIPLAVIVIAVIIGTFVYVFSPIRPEK